MDVKLDSLYLYWAMLVQAKQKAAGKPFWVKSNNYNVYGMLFMEFNMLECTIYTAQNHLILAYPTRISVNTTRLGNVVLHEGCKTTLVCDVSMTILTSFLISWGHFHVSFRQTFRHQHIRKEPYGTFLDRKM